MDKVACIWCLTAGAESRRKNALHQKRMEARVGSVTALTYFLMALVFGVISFVNLSMFIDDHKAIRAILFLGYSAVVVTYLVRSYRARRDAA